MALVEAIEPVGQQVLEDLLVERFFRREVVQQARPPDADAGGDVVERGAVVAGVGEARHRLVEDLLPGAARCRFGFGRLRRAG